MEALEISLNELLVKVYRSMEKLEEVMLRASKDFPLSISEVHMLEAVAAAGGDGDATISGISEYLDIRLPSVTAGVNKMVAKGYLTKEKCGNDARVVRVSLTRQGRRAERAHRYFHRGMVRSVMAELSDEEKTVLVKGVGKLSSFLDRNIEKYDV